ncbi:MAG TPA: hypothetical protein VM431_13780 [Phycisphaerae bacterium]|nr:hypothetical protein [Phycisphaerae bacterium]
MSDEREDAGADAQGERPADTETADAEDWNTSKRILCLVLAAPVIGVGVWLLQAYQGTSLLIGLGILAAAGIVFVGALLLVAIGLLGLPSGTGAKGVDPLEEEAERRGMPTDPEAYQDGGVGVAATGRTTTEAELIAAELNARDIPAWVDQAYTSTVLWHAQFALNPEGVRVLVPLGRLADARRVVDETRDQEGTSEEDEEPAPRRSLRRTGVAIYFLCSGLGMMVFAIILAYSAATHGPRLGEVASSILTGLLGIGALTAGVLGLRTKSKPED